MPPATRFAALRRKFLPRALRGKPMRRIQREINQRRYDYPNRNLLAVGLPKSGSTWLARMLCEVPGYLPWTPETVKLGKPHDLRRDDFIPGPVGYTVTKTHTFPSESNLSVIHATGRPYVVLIRDPRDTATSWAYYVGLPGRTFWAHPEAVPLSIPERIAYYIERILPRNIEWIVRWQECVDPRLGLLFRYEDMLIDTFGHMRRAFDLYDVRLSDDRVREIVAKHEFKKATGRERGQEDAKSFNRKGIRGDWRNHFTDDHIAAFKRIAGQKLIASGYEADESW